MILISLVLLLAGCGASSTTDKGRIKVVAAENFWGSIAKQLGGDKVQAVSIITNPDTDPHDYDPTAADGRTMAESQLAVLNGLGYDSWAQKLLNANPDSQREVINVGSAVGLKDGDNPHRWYSPTNVLSVIDTITERLQNLDPADFAYFQAQHDSFVTKSLAAYNDARASIKAKFSGTPVGATESIVTPLAADLGLNLVTPPSFLSAISEGTDPTASDKATADKQITNQAIKVLVFNAQNATPDVQALVSQANSAHIPVVSVTETLTPPNTTFQQWQTDQLQALQNALNTATIN